GTTTAAEPAFHIGLGLGTVSVKNHQGFTLPVRVSTAAGAAPQNYQGDIVLTSRGTGAKLHIPVWERIVPTAPTADVLLVDDDGSDFGPFRNYGPLYRHVFDAAGINYRFLDVHLAPSPDP